MSSQNVTFSRPRVVSLSLSPSSETLNKQKKPREILISRASRAQEFARPFFLAVFFHVTHDGLQAREGLLVV